MRRKVFVSYKYNDSSVQNLKPYFNSTVRDYVDILESLIGKDNIYKGEHDGEDLSDFKKEWIWTKLKEKIFDSKVTIVLISPNMKDNYISEENQWIPQEISYSLKEISRNKIYSRANALVYVILPEENGGYRYYKYNTLLSNLPFYNTDIIFEIMSNNLHNQKKQFGNESYAVTVTWEDFINNIDKYIEIAIEKQSRIDEFEIAKNIKSGQFN